MMASWFVVFVYVVIVALSGIIGSITGVGGVLTKIGMDLVGVNNAVVISFYSSVSVLVMAIISIAKHWHAGFHFKPKLLISISTGSIVGGYIGQQILASIYKIFPDRIVKMSQSGILFIILVIIFIYSLIENKVKHWNIQLWELAVIIGFVLGLVAVFLGIGGGILNLAVLLVMFGLSNKDAAVYSLGIAFFSTLSKFVNITITHTIIHFNPIVLIAVVITVIITAYIGTALKMSMKNSGIGRLYSFVLLIMIIMTGFNFIRML